MGYTTDFFGDGFLLDRKLNPEHSAYLRAFSETRRMKRNPSRTSERPDPLRKAVSLPVGIEGEFFVNEEGYRGQGHGDDILDNNEPPSTQPGLWCQWLPSEDGNAIVWDCGEKFYDYIEWLQYMIDNFITRWGYKLNGSLTWQGEDEHDRGEIRVINNHIYHGNPSSVPPLVELALVLD
ncbi:MAG: hypothetical protein MN733_16680 [Nitrososphaera sp.]|nr:hypothetical protein [Nitrososphaera sp.]